jgi:hypothetical protein
MKRSLILAALVAAVLLVLYWMRRPTARVDITDKAVKPLTASETARVTFDADKLITLTHEGPKSRYIPPESSVVLTVDHDGDVTEEIDDYGFTFELGPAIVFSDRLRAGVDCEFWYWNRLGLNTGLAFAPRGIVVSPYLALSYQLDQLHLNNTSLLLGITAHREPVVGLRIAF